MLPCWKPSLISGGSDGGDSVEDLGGSGGGDSDEGFVSGGGGDISS